jgi:hypothetical protein
VDGDALADIVEVADLGSREATFPFEVLGLEPDACEREDLVALTQAGMAVNDDMRMQFAAGSQHHILADHTIGPNLAVGANPGLGMDNGRRMRGEFALIFCHFTDRHAFP